MHLRIYLWLSCVVLAGYVRATEEGVAESAPTVETAAPPQNDGPLSSNLDGFVDDEGSGHLDVGESSGSGWGPGPDDEDGPGGSGAGPEDDEDFPLAPRHSSTTPQPDDFVPELDSDETSLNTDKDSSATEHTSTQVPNLPYDVVYPRVITGGKPIEEIEEPRSNAGVDAPPRPETDISVSGEDIGSGIDQTGVDHDGSESRQPDNVVFIMNAKPEDRPTSFFAQPGILAAVIGGAVVGLLCAILVVMFIVYRMRKKDEGSYALDEPKRSPAAASYGKGHNNREFYA